MELSGLHVIDIAIVFVIVTMATFLLAVRMLCQLTRRTKMG